MNELPAGRELDALIAEKVMGLKLKLDKQDFRPGCLVHPRVEQAGDPWYVIVPHFSTNIAPAWAVVEKLRAISYEPCINGECWTPTERRRGLWFADFQNGGPSNQAEAETAPLAICRAALKVIEGVTT